jgi:hypothetical protein
METSHRRGTLLLVVARAAAVEVCVRDPRVDVVRSAARKRGASAGLRGGKIVVRVPEGMPAAAEDALVERLVARLVARASVDIVGGAAVGLPDSTPARATRVTRGPRGDAWLVARADAVADRWLPGVRATDVRWSHRMESRWASCSVATKRVRVSHRLADAPDPVLDHILLHEQAHLIVADHSRSFQALINRDPARAAVDAWLERRTVLELRAVLGLV